MSHNSAFDTAFKRLNTNQRRAVEQIDGPLLVIAGPGTGKTQLLSARVAYILKQTDTLPQNILCLTFTESGASNMRERLSRFIGPAAYDVTIGTYHAFGGELIGRFPQYFGNHREQRPIDSLGQREIIQAIVDEMPFNNPLKSTQYHLHDLLSTISEVKRGLLTEDDLRAIAQDNLTFLEDTNKEITEIFADFSIMPRKAEKALPYFQNLYNYLKQRDQEAYTIGGSKVSSTGKGTAAPKKGIAAIHPLANFITFDLEQALYNATADESTKPLTTWKNQWLEKDTKNNFMIAGQRESERIAALANVLHQYTETLENQGLYDFDDMILRGIQALEQHPDLRFTLHEQYQYILLDEFQDTNAAQLKLMQLLTNNPVSEGRPNVMAVGDDDQAIYAFQGAEVSNMLDFVQMYRNVRVINLTENYRSHPHILHVAHEIAEQIDTRLTSHFNDMEKVLTAAGAIANQEATIDRHEFQSDVAQYSWIANEIDKLIKNGATASEIAVLAPRHKQLEPLVAFLNQRDIPVRYEKRENILETPVVQQILAISRLVLSLKNGQDGLAESLWPEVLSYDFWSFSTTDIWQLSWHVRETKELTWNQAILANETFRQTGLLLLTLAQQVGTESLETMLDRIIGNEAVKTGEKDQPTVQSPLRAYYLGDEVRAANPDLFYQTLSHLTVLRQKLRDHQKATEDTLQLPDLLALVALYEAAGERMLNTSPYNQHANAVQLMTVFKAKGLEFEHVFLPSCQDDVWGESSRGQSNRLALPANLAPIRPAGSTQDERLRIFFVAVTRAKIGLHLTSFLRTYSGRATKRLKYLHEVEGENDSFQTLVLPANSQAVSRVDHQPPQLHDLELNWRHRHLDSLQETSLRDLLSERLERYQLSPTHLTTFVDLVYAGPESFFFNCLLNFPSAPSDDAQYGNAVHETLQWYQLQINAAHNQQQQASLFPDTPDASDTPSSNSKAPVLPEILVYFEGRLQQKHLPANRFQTYLERGNHTLEAYLQARSDTFHAGDRAEYNFRNENVMIDEIRLTGKIDRMLIDHANKVITVIDYKTGSSYDRWTNDLKLHKYRLQLYCYKILIEHSRTYRGYKVAEGLLEFVEPNEAGKISSLRLQFDDRELQQTIQLLQAVWNKTMSLDFPDTSNYDQTPTGSKRFENSLLAD
jgi:DNA helicase-2/ATP-dependent DNA helicase PcrA